MKLLASHKEPAMPARLDAVIPAPVQPDATMKSPAALPVLAYVGRHRRPEPHRSARARAQAGAAPTAPAAVPGGAPVSG
jgi:hypothetical protein